MRDWRGTEWKRYQAFSQYRTEASFCFRWRRQTTSNYSPLRQPSWLQQLWKHVCLLRRQNIRGLTLWCEKIWRHGARRSIGERSSYMACAAAGPAMVEFSVWTRTAAQRPQGTWRPHCQMSRADFDSIIHLLRAINYINFESCYICMHSWGLYILLSRVLVSECLCQVWLCMHVWAVCVCICL